MLERGHMLKGMEAAIQQVGWDLWWKQEDVEFCPAICLFFMR